MSKSSFNPRRSIFRPCIDLHEGKVKQIVGGTLTDDNNKLQTNFISRSIEFILSVSIFYSSVQSNSAIDFALLYRKNNLLGGHIIKLGPGNDDAAVSALSAWPGNYVNFYSSIDGLNLHKADFRLVAVSRTKMLSIGCNVVQKRFKFLPILPVMIFIIFK